MTDATDPLEDLGAFIRLQRQQAGLSLRGLAGAAGVSNPYLSQIERGIRRPSAEILQAVAGALDVEVEVLYVKAGFLETRGIPVELAVAEEPALTPGQRRVLITIYRTFLRLNALEDAPADGPADTGREPDELVEVPSSPHERGRPGGGHRGAPESAGEP